MKTFDVEYEIPPLRAIYRLQYESENEETAKADFAQHVPLGRIRKIECVDDNPNFGITGG